MGFKRRVRRKRTKRLVKAYRKGWRAYWVAMKGGREEAEANPHKDGTEAAIAWDAGMKAAADGKKI